MGRVEVPEDVTLVLQVVVAATEEVLTVASDHLGVVARGDRVEAEAFGSFEEQVKFDMSIALDARIGRPSGGVPVDEGGDDSTFELLGVVKDVMVDAERLGHASRVIDVSD